MARLFQKAGVPDGVVNVVTGTGPVAGEALLRHPGVDKIAFTGSTAIGRHVASAAGEALKPVTMELGGNAAHIVFEDADVEKAVGAVIKGFVFNTGQFCMGGPRLLVARPVYQTLIGILADAVPGVPVGDPRLPETVVGPMAGEALRKVEEYVALARKEGARIVCGGERLDLDGGYYYKPTVIADLTNDSRVVQEEIFGPVLTVQPFDSEDEAVQLANSTPYGLASASRPPTWPAPTGSPTGSRRASSGSTTGRCSTPRSPSAASRTPASGREHGPEALAAYTRVKSVVVSLD